MSRVVRALARIIFGNEGLSRRLETSALVQGLAHRLRARAWVNAALRRLPIRRQLPSGVRYHIETFEALAVERAYFRNPVYREIFAANPPATFIDLGCNSGLFPCLLADIAGGKTLRGLCVDANAAQVELVQKTIRLNGWNEIHVRCGLVGARLDETGEAEFFLHPTSLGSSQYSYQDSESGHAPEWKRILVPTLKVAPLWSELFDPDLRCACLKIDIEGSEMNFLHVEDAFLRRVDSILLEWHLWGTTRKQVSDFLIERGFRLERTVEDAPRNGVLFFRRG
jgi:FkbM family methyltransferase